MWCHRLSESMLVVVTEPSKRLLIPAWNITVPSAFCTMAQPLVFNRSNSIAGLPPALASPLERIQKLIVPVLELKLVFGGTTIWLGTLAVKLITPDRVTLPLSVLLASHDARSNTSFNSSTGTISFWMRSSGLASAGGNPAMLFDRLNTNGCAIVQNADGTVMFQAGISNLFDGSVTT